MGIWRKFPIGWIGENIGSPDKSWNDRGNDICQINQKTDYSEVVRVQRRRKTEMLCKTAHFCAIPQDIREIQTKDVSPINYGD